MNTISSRRFNVSPRMFPDEVRMPKGMGFIIPFLALIAGAVVNVPVLMGIGMTVFLGMVCREVVLWFDGASGVFHSAGNREMIDAALLE